MPLPGAEDSYLQDGVASSNKNGMLCTLEVPHPPVLAIALFEYLLGPAVGFELTPHSKIRPAAAAIRNSWLRG